MCLTSNIYILAVELLPSLLCLMASFSACSSACCNTTSLDIGRPQAGVNGSHVGLLIDSERQKHEYFIRASSKSNQESCCRKRVFLLGLLGAAPILVADSHASADRPLFRELEGSHGLKALDILEGSGGVPHPGDKVEIHYYARLAAKQGWRFDSTYDHKDSTGAPEPYVFVLGSGTVIEGLDMAVQTMKEGGVRRVIIPPAQGYQNMLQGPIPPNVFDRQRLYTTIFNPTRLANGEGSTLGTLIFDIRLLKVRPN